MNATARIGVLGGSGVYGLDGMDSVGELAIDTPYGPTSDAVQLGELTGVPIAFLARHGAGHRFLPSEVPYRANLHALRSLGVRRVLSVSAAGSLREDLPPGTFVLPDQFIDRTTRRESTFFGDGIVAHVPMSEPVDAAMIDVLQRAAHSLGLQARSGGTYVCIEGPQFSTRAESELYRSWGCDVIGMTNATEAKLCREAGMSYCSVAMITDFDCWHSQHGQVTIERIIATARANAANARRLVSAAIPHLDRLGPSPWNDVLKGAVMTAPDQVPPQARARTAVLFGDQLADSQP
ncbi:MAG TPA: S-methyl-5'-thioadenosine phosphorylase [Planctomycetota bacterium]